MKRILTSYPLAMMLMSVLVGCAAGAEEVVDVPDDPAVPMTFEAYVGRTARSAATVGDITGVDALAQVGGFGVFGYAQGQVKFDNYILNSAVPNFFVNQQVTYVNNDDNDNDDDGHWTYEPVKYYDNNPGARHSFFAYAPYDKDADMVFTTGKAPQLSYAIERDVDLLWSEPARDRTKPGATEKITFNFIHALSKTTFYVAPIIDLAHATDAHPLPDENVIPEGTTIRVRNIHINGDIPYTGLLNTATGQWIPDRKGDHYNVPGASVVTWTGDGATPITHYTEVGSSKLIPTREVTIEVIYDVITGVGDDKSHITNKAVSTHTFALEQSKAYRFYLDLGLTSVKFTAQVVDWTIDKEPEMELQWTEPFTCIQLPWSDVDGSGMDVGL